MNWVRAKSCIGIASLMTISTAGRAISINGGSGEGGSGEDDRGSAIPSTTSKSNSGDGGSSPLSGRYTNDRTTSP